MPRRRRPGRREAGTGSRIVVKPDYDEGEISPDISWSLETYPWPDVRLAPDPDIEMATTPERLFWRADADVPGALPGCLAVRAGGEYAVELLPYLCPVEEI